MNHLNIQQQTAKQNPSTCEFVGKTKNRQQHPAQRKAQQSTARKQRGYVAMEYIAVAVVISVIAIFAIPRINSWIISGKVGPTANDMVQAVLRIRANAEGSGATPYTSMNTAAIANTLRERSSALTVAGTTTTATMTHAIGATSAAVTAAPATLTSLGDSFAVTFADVNKGACPELATRLQNVSEAITINGTPVKAAATAYNGQTAENACTGGNTNTFVFTMR